MIWLNARLPQPIISVAAASLIAAADQYFKLQPIVILVIASADRDYQIQKKNFFLFFRFGCIIISL